MRAVDFEEEGPDQPEFGALLLREVEESRVVALVEVHEFGELRAVPAYGDMACEVWGLRRDPIVLRAVRRDAGDAPLLLGQREAEGVLHLRAQRAAAVVDDQVPTREGVDIDDPHPRGHNRAHLHLAAAVAGGAVLVLEAQPQCKRDRRVVPV